MNKEIKSCDIVQELLPLYMEKRTGEESNQYVEKHLAECEECRENHKWMNMDYSRQLKREVPSTDRQSNQVGKKRKHLTPTNKRILIMILALLGYIGLMGLIVIGTFMYLTGM